MPPRGLCEWETMVSSHMLHLSKPQVKVLAFYSFGMAMTRSCGLTGTASFLSEVISTASFRRYHRCTRGSDNAGVAVAGGAQAG
ncbi:MAG: hypothetical protein ACUVWR_00230 [Anaerolineae bacterium]